MHCLDFTHHLLDDLERKMFVRCSGDAGHEILCDEGAYDNRALAGGLAAHYVTVKMQRDEDDGHLGQHREAVGGT